MAEYVINIYTDSDSVFPSETRVISEWDLARVLMQLGMDGVEYELKKRLPNGEEI